MHFVFVHKINPNNVISELVDYVNLMGEFLAFYLKVNFKNA